VRVALVGNPNSGKSSLFNILTGLNQKIGNFPGITVEKHVGTSRLSQELSAEIIDLPGTYSIYPRSLDERIVSEVLLDHHSSNTPDVVVVVADATNLKRGLLLLTQIIDLGVPCLLALNMMDLAARAKLSYDLNKLSEILGVDVIPINARDGSGIDALKLRLARTTLPSSRSILPVWEEAKKPVEELRNSLGIDNDYEAYLFLEQPQSLGFLSNESRKLVDNVRAHHDFFPGKFQGAETIRRYGFIQDTLNEVTLHTADPEWKRTSRRLDRILTHRIFGYVIFFLILFLIFQSIFTWAEVPMDLIDGFFASASDWLGSVLPAGPLTNLVTHGILPGIGGIVIFIPQIAILFCFISLLEESGYMARVVFLMDKIMRKFGLNGKSVVPLMSGVACAIPAIMSTRTIDNYKERIITIFVTPLMSCSARLPVFTILIALIIPEQAQFWIFNLQGLTLMGLYLLGFAAAIFSAMIMNLLLKNRERSYLIMELPAYRWPKWSNVGFTLVEKTKAFVFEAGKIILAISIVLWVLASYSPYDTDAAVQAIRDRGAAQSVPLNQVENEVAAYKLETSYAGIIGKTLEPVIRPLGYDWKIGIALITSFAAREVFVGTIATIYSIGDTDPDDTTTIRSRLKAEINPRTGGPMFTPAVGFSLLIFYTFAMQCMSTIAVVYRETKGWRWPMIQLVYLSLLAYLAAWTVFHVLS
jgi:ferrous iron transport protein B